MSEPCVFCGQPWVPNHSAVCKGRPTPENKVAAAHRFLGIKGGQANDPMLQDQKVLDYLVKRKQAHLKEMSIRPPVNLPGTGPGRSSFIHDATPIVSLLYLLTLGTFMLIDNPVNVLFGEYRWRTLAFTCLTLGWIALDWYDGYTYRNHPNTKRREAAIREHEQQVKRGQSL